MRGKRQGGDVLTIGTVAGASTKKYPLAQVPNNISYKTVSTQPEAQPNQPVTANISFHGGLASDHYDERSGECLVNTGILCNEQNVLRAPVKVNTVTLTGANSPPMYFFETTAPAATVTHGTSDSVAVSAGTTGTISSFTVGSNDDRLLVVHLCFGSGTNNDSTVTFGGTGLSKWAVHDDSSIQTFIMVSPTASTADIVATWTGNEDCAILASYYYGVDQNQPFRGATPAASNADEEATKTVTSASGELVMDVVSVLSGPDITVGANQTNRQERTETGGVTGGTSTEAGGASITMSWTWSGAQDWAQTVMPIRPSQAPRLYIISVEPHEVNAYKLSLEASDFSTLLNTKTWTVTTTSPMGRPAEWTSGGSTVWLAPLGDNGKIDSLTTVAATTSNDTWSGGTDANARHLLVVKDQLYRLDGANQINILPRNTDPETDSGWTGAHYVGDAGFKVTDLAQVGGVASIPKEDGLWEFDGVASATNILPELGIADHNGQGLSYGRGGFFVPGVAGLYWTRTGEPVGPESHDDTHTANDPSIGAGEYFKHGRWMGTANYNGHFYGLYVNSAGTTGFIAWAYPVNQQWRFHVLASVTADFDEFHGIHVSETSRFTDKEIRPCLWFANGNDISYIWLDKNGAPMLRRGDVDVAAAATATSGRIDFGYPRVLKQLHYISGWADDMVTSNTFTCKVYRDGATDAETVGSAVSADGYFDEYFTQDTDDTCRSLLFSAVWAASGDTTDLNGPHLRDVQIHAVLQPAVTRVWEFLVVAEDTGSRTAKAIRTNWEGYIGDLLKFELPDGDSFNGVASPLELLRPDEVRDLFNQDPPSYVFRATVREMPSS
jgi:hypothetical protein